jgi:hypothetical protein
VYLNKLNLPVLYLEEGVLSTGAWVCVWANLVRLMEMKAGVFFFSCNKSSDVLIENMCFNTLWWT